MKNTIRLALLTTTIFMLLSNLVLNTQAQYDNTSCNSIKGSGGSSGDGIYTINPTGNEEFEVYCDMTTDGGGWTLVARSVDSGTGDFGWSVSRGDPSLDSSPYSMGINFRNIDFSEIMLARYENGKNIELAVKMNLNKSSLINAGSSSVSTNNSCEIVYDEGISEGERSWGHCRMPLFWGYSSNSKFFFRDHSNDDSGNYGLHPGRLSTYLYNDSHGSFHGKQGMIFIRDDFVLNGVPDSGQTTTTLSITGGTTSVFTPTSINFGELEVSSSEQEKNIELEAPNYFGIEDLKGQGGYYTTLQIGELSDGDKTLEVTEAKVRIANLEVHTIAGQEGSNISVPAGVSDFILFDSENPANILERAVTTNGKIGKYGVLPHMKLTIAAYQQVGDYEGTITFTIIEDGSISPIVYASCKELLDNRASSTSGVYTINPSGSEEFEVYCDMETDGGGWTMIESLNYTNSLSSTDTFGNRSFTNDYPSNENSDGSWNLSRWRLSKSNIQVLLTENKFYGRVVGLNNEIDLNNYAIIEGDFTTNETSGGYFPTTGKVRGYSLPSNSRWWNNNGSHLHLGTPENGIPNYVTSEDGFGYYYDVNSTHFANGEYTQWFVR